MIRHDDFFFLFLPAFTLRDAPAPAIETAAKSIIQGGKTANTQTK